MQKPPGFLQDLTNRCALPGIIRYVALLNALVFLLHLISPGYLSALELDPRLVLRGEVWRLLTWIFIPETLSPFWIFFSLLFLLYIGEGLESAMGASRLTLFYLCGIVLCTAVNMAFGLFDGGGAVGRANTFLNLSLMLAFATLYPDFKVLLFFFLPVRIIWLALFSALIMLLGAIGEPVVVAATLGAAFLNYLLFFRVELASRLHSWKIRGIPQPRLMRGGMKRGHSNTSISAQTLHLCHVCGRTEASHPDLEFRVSADGNEYCREHLPGR